MPVKVKLSSPFLALLKPFLLVYCVIYALLGSVMLTSCVIISFMFILVIMRIPPPDDHRSDKLMEVVGGPTIVAHRGGGYDAPENTISAVRNAKKNGATAVEFDLDYTKDGTPIVFHDDTVDRCTDGTGLIREFTLEEVKQLNASANHPRRDDFPDETIPTLVEMVHECLAHDLTIFIDVKSRPGQSSWVLSTLFKQHPELYTKAIVCSFYPTILYAIRSRDPKITGALIHRSYFLSRESNGTRRDGGSWIWKFICPYLDTLLQWSMYEWLWYICGTSAFLGQVGDVSASVVDHFAERGVKVCVWTANRPEDRRYFLNSLRCSIITDTMSDDGIVPSDHSIPSSASDDIAPSSSSSNES